MRISPHKIKAFIAWAAMMCCLIALNDLPFKLECAIWLAVGLAYYQGAIWLAVGLAYYQGALSSEGRVKRLADMADKLMAACNKNEEKLTKLEAVRLCTDERLAEGEFSGGRRERCTAYMTSDGETHNTCGEPCRWIMQKGGHGSPAWP